MGKGWNILLGFRAFPRTRGARCTGRANISPGGMSPTMLYHGGNEGLRFVSTRALAVWRTRRARKS
jgi:hypothetical protein